MTYQAATKPITEREVVKEWMWNGIHYPPVKGQPPLDFLDAQKWADFPQATGKHTFRVTSQHGATKQITVSHHTLHVLLGIMQRPVVCASRARVSQYIGKLKNELGVQIETVMYDGGAWGLYFLISKVELVQGGDK
jgi:hypothetical protein